MLISCHALELPLPDESVQCIVTSPPYWGLRKYAGMQDRIWSPNLPSQRGTSTTGLMMTCAESGHEFVTERYYTEQTAANETDEAFSSPGEGNATRLKNGRWRDTSTCVRCGAWRGAFGLEPTIEMYVEHTVEILRELRRVLRRDGVLFWNVGDSYAASRSRGSGGSSVETSPIQRSNSGSYFDDDLIAKSATYGALKSKDLCLIPARVVLAAQADGWWIRSQIIWAKPNPMPESVQDRPTDAYEHILMLTRSERYFWDAVAVREKAVAGWNGSSFTDDRDAEVYANLGQGPRAFAYYQPKGTHYRGAGDGGPKAQERGSYQNWTDGTREVLGSRNMRNVWMFATQPYAGAHFATFPEEIPRRCILAATSERGACARCGAPWQRLTEPSDEYASKLGTCLGNDSIEIGKARGFGESICADYKTIGWEPTCECGSDTEATPETVKCVVLDPFAGSGTTGRVALELRRQPILCDLAYARATPEDVAKGREYDRLAQERLKNVQITFPLL